jgi:integrase
MGRTRKEVVDRLAIVMRAHDERRSSPNQREKLGPFLRRWLDEVARPTLRESTYASYNDILDGHLIPGLGRHAIEKLTPAEVQTYLNSKLAVGLSPRRVQYIHAVLRRALRTAERWGMVSRNVAKLVDPPRVPKHEITPLTPAQARQLIEAAANDRLRALWITALGTGLRQGELLALRWDDVDLDAGRLRVRYTLPMWPAHSPYSSRRASGVGVRSHCRTRWSSHSERIGRASGWNTWLLDLGGWKPATYSRH